MMIKMMTHENTDDDYYYYFRCGWFYRYHDGNADFDGSVSFVQLAGKYDPEAEVEVISWFKALLNEDIQPGMREVEKQLRNGQLLVKYAILF